MRPVILRRVGARPVPAALASALCGGLAALGQVPWSLWPVGLAGIAATIALIAAASGPGAAALRAWAAGSAHFAVALHWIVEPFQVDIEAHAWMAPFALVFMATGLALFWAAAGALAVLLRPAARALGIAAALAAAEAARGVVLTGFPWAQPGHLWLGTPVEQAAAWIGATGLGALTLGLVALPVLWRMRGAVATGAAVALLWAAGTWQQGQPVPAPGGAVVRLVQPDAAQHLKWDPAMARLFFDRLLRFTGAAPAPDLAIWPETAVPFLLNDDRGGLGMVAGAAGGVPVLLGIQRTEGWRAWNSLALIDAEGAIADVYDKHHLVPFGEYIPLGDLAADWFGITAFAAQRGQGYSAGPGPRLIDLGPLGQVLPLICYEAIFPGGIRGAPERPDWMVQVTNDAWFGERAGPFQHLSLARLRSIEFGLPLLRVANTGVTAAFDARGRELATIPLNRAGFLDVALPAALPATGYARLGEVPLLLLLLVLGVGALTLHRRADKAA